jgi:hypothetical protein
VKNMVPETHLWSLASETPAPQSDVAATNPSGIPRDRGRFRHPMGELRSTTELVEPMPAFDAGSLCGTIFIRPAKPGEGFRALNDEEYVLGPANLVGAHEEAAIAGRAALAGPNEIRSRVPPENRPRKKTVTTARSGAVIARKGGISWTTFWVAF